MCSPSRASLFTGRYPAEHGVELTLTAADLRPDPRNFPAVAATMAGILRNREAPPRRVLRQFTKGALRIGESRGNEPVLPRGMPQPRDAAAGRGLPRRLQGQVAPDPSLQRKGRAARRVGPRRRRADRARLRLRRLGGPRRGRERQGRALRRRQRRRGGGVGRGLHPRRPSAGWGARICPSPSASSSRSSTRTTCSATPPRMSAAATPATSSATSASGCRRPSRRICAASPLSTR